VGGIKLQVIDGVTGFLVHSPESAANRIAGLLGNRRLRERMGEDGCLHVKDTYLVTWHARDYMLAILALEHRHENIVSLA
jgi:trehalose synthase